MNKTTKPKPTSQWPVGSDLTGPLGSENVYLDFNTFIGKELSIQPTAMAAPNDVAFAVQETALYFINYVECF